MRPSAGSPVPRLESLYVVAAALVGFVWGVRPISDNSALTHLRTGLMIAQGGGIPRWDPYSFSAHGHRWVDQSWLAEWSYGWALRIGGSHLVVFEQGLLLAALAGLLAHLGRGGSPLRTGAAAVVVILLGIPLWSPRPLVIGLLCLAVTVWIVVNGRSRWLLLPLTWVWVNAHGSFPLGVAWLVVLAAGEALDSRRLPKAEMGYLGTFVLGLVVAALNPLGVRLLGAPLVVVQKRVVFHRVAEWRSPDFQAGAGIVLLVGLTLALAIVLWPRHAGGLGWRHLLPGLGFIALGLLSVRNIAAASVVLAPVLGAALRTGSAGGTGTGSASGRILPATPALADDPVSRVALNRLVAVMLAVVLLGSAVAVWRRPGLDLSSYPQGAVTFLDHAGLLGPPHRTAEQDRVGNYLTYRYGPRVPVFIDDRVDMYPVSISNDYASLFAPGPTTLAVLACLQIDLVLWGRADPLPTLLGATGSWHQIYEDKSWVVYQRVGGSLPCPSGRH